MAKRVEVQLACDICGRNGAHQWLIGNPQGERAKVDLCSRCDDPCRKAFVAGRRSATGPQGADAIEIISDYKPAARQEPVVPWSSAKEKRG